MSKSDNRCVFCRIANLQDPYTRILFQDEEFVAFRDIRPAADHHYLIVTKQHIKNPKQLKAEDLEMFERLIATGEKVLENAGGKYEEARMRRISKLCQLMHLGLSECVKKRFGFHWPPFTSVNHLHLHVISPVLSMNFLSRLIFRENSYWFVTANWMSNRLKTMKNESADRTKDQSNL